MCCVSCDAANAQSDHFQVMLSTTTFAAVHLHVLHSYEELMVGGPLTKSDIDLTKRESYLREDDFARVFGLSKEAFGALPKWKQNARKKELKLF